MTVPNDGRLPNVKPRMSVAITSSVHAATSGQKAIAEMAGMTTRVPRSPLPPGIKATIQVIYFGAPSLMCSLLSGVYGDSSVRWLSWPRGRLPDV